MAYQPVRTRFNPMLVGAIAVILALAAFLIFRDSSVPTQQAGVENPPATSAPSTNPTDPKGTNL